MFAFVLLLARNPTGGSASTSQRSLFFDSSVRLICFVASKEKDFVAFWMPVITHKTLSTIPPLTNSLVASHHRILLCLLIPILCYPVIKITIVFICHILLSRRHCVNYNCVFHLICDLKRTLSSLPIGL